MGSTPPTKVPAARYPTTPPKGVSVHFDIASNVGRDVRLSGGSSSRPMERPEKTIGESIRPRSRVAELRRREQAWTRPRTAHRTAHNGPYVHGGFSLPARGPR